MRKASKNRKRTVMTMPSFYDLMCYAKTGIASPDMTAYDKMRARAAFGGYPIRTITGSPPLSFRADGRPLISWSMLGNTQQTGTPSPDNIIMPTFCGVRTGNLFDKSTITLGKYINAQNVEVDSKVETPVQALNHTDYIEIQPNKDYTYHYKFRCGVRNTIALCWFDANKNLISRITKTVVEQDVEYTLTGESPANAVFCIINFTGYLPNESMELSFNIGSAALPYEPYGWKLSLTSAGQTQTVFLGQVQTVRRIKKLVLDGTEDWTYITGGKHWAPVYNYQKSGVMCICTHYEAVANGSGSVFIVNGKVGFYSSASNRIIFCDTNYTTTDDWKSYLAQQYANGNPVTVWYVLAEPETAIVNEPLAKIDTYADELHSEDAGVTIPTVRGSNVLTVDTDLQPSQVSITGHIKHV